MNWKPRDVYLVAVLALLLESVRSYASSPVPQWCTIVLEAVVSAHREVVERSEIDPFRRALFLLRAEQKVPMVPDSHPESLVNFEKSLEATLRTTGTIEARLQAIADFQTQWKLTDRSLYEILLAYRTFGRFASSLREIISDRQAQHLSAWTKYQTFLANHPRLQARYDYYLGTVGRRSVPEMVSDLFPNDSVITESKVRKEITALHLSIEEEFQTPLEPLERQNFDSEMVRLKIPPLPATLTTRLEAIEHARRHSVNHPTIGRALAIDAREIDFYLHHINAVPQTLPWDRMVIDANGIRSTEEQLLRTLRAARLPVAEIAAELNASRGRELSQSLLPSDIDFRTAAATQAKLSALGLTSPQNHDLRPVTIPPFGLLKREGELQIEALFFIRDRRQRGESYATIANQLRVTALTVREFEAKWSEQLATGLPQALRRFLTPPASGGGAGGGSIPILPVNNPPVAGAHRAFDAFHEALPHVTGWEISNGLKSELEQMGEKLPSCEAKRRWLEKVAALPASLGKRIRGQKESADQRGSRFRLFELLEEAIDIYNSTRDPKDQIKETDLGSEQALHKTIGLLRGKELPEKKLVAPKKGIDPSFDAFSENFSELDGWEIGSNFQSEMLTLSENFKQEPDKAAWALRIGKLSIWTGQSARSSSPRNHLFPRYRMYEILKEAVTLYNKERPPEEHLKVEDLATGEGMRDLIAKLRGKRFTISSQPFPKGANPLFERFVTHFNALDGFEISADAAQERELRTLSTSFKREADRKSWGGIVEETPPSAGASARKLAVPEQDRRNGRQYIFQVLLKAIERYNRDRPVSEHLKPEQLGDERGLRKVVETLRGQAYPREIDIPEPGIDPLFDKFDPAFYSMRGWEIGSDHTFPAELKRLSQGFKNEEDEKEWEAEIPRWSSATGTRIRENRPHARNYRYHVYHLLRRAIESYNRGRESAEHLKVEDMATETGLRSIIGALRGEEIGEKYRAPLPKTDPAFDDFHTHFSGLDAWEISGRNDSFNQEIKLLGSNFIGDSAKEEWTSYAEKVPRWIGSLAGRNDAAAARGGHYRLILILREAIARYNNERPPHQQLSPELLRTPAGMRKVVETLRGKRLIEPVIAPATGKDPEFEKFEQVFDLLEGWPISVAENFTLQATKLSTHFLDAEDVKSWGNVTERIPKSTGGGARASVGTYSDGHIRTSTYRIYWLLKEAVIRYNKERPAAEQIDLQDLTTDKLRETVEKLLGNPIPAAKNNAPALNENPTFDAFVNHYEALNGWKIAGSQAFVREVGSLANHFVLKEDQHQWKKKVEQLPARLGERARNAATEPSRRYYRNFMFQLLTSAIEGYNKGRPISEHLSKEALQTPAGIRATVKALGGSVIE